MNTLSTQHSGPNTHTTTRAVFLDVGGTLLQMGQPDEAYLDILRKHGHQVTLEQVREWLQQARQETRRLPSGPAEDFTISAERERARRDLMVRAFLDLAGVTDQLDSCQAAIWESWLGTRVFHLYPDTLSVLAELKHAGFVIGAVSNWEPRLSALCASHGIAHYFDFILASEAEGYAKPGARLFEMALERARVRPEQAIHVGDSPREDIEAAESIGIRAALIQRDQPGGGKPAHPEPVEGRSAHVHSPRIPSLHAAVPLAKASAWLRGRVVRGKGEAAQFTQVAWVQDQVWTRLGFALHPGTLNLRLEGEADLAAWARLRAHPGLPIEPQPGFCAARCYPVSVEGQVDAAIVLPNVPDYPSNVVEVLAPVALRQALGLGSRDGGSLTLAVV